MSDLAINVQNLTRSFADVHAVQGLTFEIEKGKVVGFIGANGAGKTTTMRMMVTLDLPTSGSIEINGYDVMEYPETVRKQVGWMPDDYGTYDLVTVFEYLDFYARSAGFTGTQRDKRVQEIMEFADLVPLKDRLMDSLSKGMGQRLCFGRTLLHDPDILILDEPAAGLDPKARIEFKNLIRLLVDKKKTIFISSHILSELGEMCDTLLFIDKGKIVHYGSAEELKKGHHPHAVVRVQCAGDIHELVGWVEMNPAVSLLDESKQSLRIAVEPDDQETLHQVLKKMIHDGVPIIDFHREEQALEDAFVNILKKLEEPDEGP